MKPIVYQTRLTIPGGEVRKAVHANENRSGLLITIDGAGAGTTFANTEGLQTQTGFTTFGEVVLDFRGIGNEAFARSEWWLYNASLADVEYTIYQVIGPSELERIGEHVIREIARANEALADQIARADSRGISRTSDRQFAGQTDIDFVRSCYGKGNDIPEQRRNGRGRNRANGRNRSSYLDSGEARGPSNRPPVRYRRHRR